MSNTIYPIDVQSVQIKKKLEKANLVIYLKSRKEQKWHFLHFHVIS